MSEFNCPHCGQEGEPNYDDSEWFEENDDGIEYECGACEKTYRVNVCISINYEATCIDHVWGLYERYTTDPSPITLTHFEKMEKHAWCKDCGACGDLEDIKV